VFWSVGNETLLRPGPDPNALVAHLASIAAAEDPTRMAAYAADATHTESPVNFHGAAHGFNEYQGWYGGTVADFATWADASHAAHPTDAIGVTEYGAGASTEEHAANPAALDTGADHTGGAHSEEYQAYYHERMWAALAARPFLWCKFVWAGFDFASDARTEGSSPGINDKGLVTFDRQTKKDAFYLYKAHWSSEPFVHIAGRRFADLPKLSRSIRVYSNASSVEVELNGVSLGTRFAADRSFVWEDVTWAEGVNVVSAVAAGALRDAVTWTK
jgi:beta-galactosidase